jgi:hypothetical protein
VWQVAAQAPVVQGASINENGLNREYLSMYSTVARADDRSEGA